MVYLKKLFNKVLKVKKHTLGLLECSTLFEILSDGSNVFFNNGASSSSSSSDLFIPLHFFEELSTS